MIRLTCLVMLASVSLVFLAGCGGDKDKGRYRDKDRPRSTTDKTSLLTPRR